MGSRTSNTQAVTEQAGEVVGEATSAPPTGGAADRDALLQAQQSGDDVHAFEVASNEFSTSDTIVTADGDPYSTYMSRQRRREIMPDEKPRPTGGNRHVASVLRDGKITPETPGEPHSSHTVQYLNGLRAAHNTAFPDATIPPTGGLDARFQRRVTELKRSFGDPAPTPDVDFAFVMELRRLAAQANPTLVRPHAVVEAASFLRNFTGGQSRPDIQYASIKSTSPIPAGRTEQRSERFHGSVVAVSLTNLGHDAEGDPLILEATVAEAFRNMHEAARRDGVNLYAAVLDSHREDHKQEQFRRQGRTRFGADETNHALGLAIDFSQKDYRVIQWLQRNASRFGFAREAGSNNAGHYIHVERVRHYSQVAQRV